MNYCQLTINKLCLPPPECTIRYGRAKAKGRRAVKNYIKKSVQIRFISIIPARPLAGAFHYCHKLKNNQTPINQLKTPK